MACDLRFGGEEQDLHRLAQFSRYASVRLLATQLCMSAPFGFRKPFNWRRYVEAVSRQVQR
jgi:hypothetical protein